MLYLKYNLVPLENAYAFQVVSQSQTLTDYVKDMGVVTTSNGWKIRVDQEPEIDTENKTIYLQGDDSSKNLNVFRHYDIPSNRVRDNVINSVHIALNDLVNKAKQSKERKPWNPFKEFHKTEDITGYYIVVIQ